MRRLMERFIPLALILCLLSIFPGAVISDSDITVTGLVGEEGQLLGDDGIIYEIAEDEKGIELMELVGHKVNVSGYVIQSDEIILITVTGFEVIEE